MTNPNPTLDDVVAEVAKLSALVKQAVAQLAQPVTVVTTDQETIIALLAQVENDAAALSAVVPAPVPATPAETPQEAPQEAPTATPGT